jgi:hypothetical protein
LNNNPYLQDLRLDAPLKAYRQQTLASLHLWTAIHAHFGHDTTSFHLNANTVQQILLFSVVAPKGEGLKSNAADRVQIAPVRKTKGNPSRAIPAPKTKTVPVAKRSAIKPKATTPVAPG